MASEETGDGAKAAPAPAPEPQKTVEIIPLEPKKITKRSDPLPRRNPAAPGETRNR